MTYGVTWGEGAPDLPAHGMIVIKTATGDTISGTADPTSFSTQISLTSELTGVAVGDMIRVTARGVYGTYGIADTVTISLKNGGTTLCTTGAQLLAANMSDRGWCLMADLVALTDSTCECQGQIIYSTSGRQGDIMDLENTSTVATGILTGNLTIDVDWNTADNANTITLRQFSAERKTE